MAATAECGVWVTPVRLGAPATCVRGPCPKGAVLPFCPPRGHGRRRNAAHKGARARAVQWATHGQSAHAAGVQHTHVFDAVEHGLAASQGLQLLKALVQLAAGNMRQRARTHAHRRPRTFTRELALRSAPRWINWRWRHRAARTQCGARQPARLCELRRLLPGAGRLCGPAPQRNERKRGEGGPPPPSLQHPSTPLADAHTHRHA